ncbi:MAG: MoaD/ThiS family protein [Acidimicrobiaceae bacterium]|nr:MoaD/ThiS family protein [Acidimicrobiaceae bacterium]MXW62132.1 MoaD/ThiS family protein [Acidimicrobiaceae bacterium]MXW76210.1 MoaD/ThiS family protein [Acidimicrobiaceae bacterium]MYA74976.1 MoaD/ThiS family protein [Acidimicrobiaceae bacterium]MYC42661.1 MoaD/ThiS family protein [Acidimicrobiaceae bacterium]
MATIRLFASAREAAGRRSDEFAGSTVGDILDAAVDCYGAEFEAVLTTCAVWRNGEPTERDEQVTDNDEIAVLPPVSGG